MGERINLIPPFTVKMVMKALSETCNYGIALHNIPDIWKVTKGEGVKVAIIDSGLPVHRDLVNQIDDSANFTNDPIEDSVCGHGCISPDDSVYTSQCGIQKISDMFDRTSGIVHFITDGSIIKDCSRQHIKTFSLDLYGNTVESIIQAVHKIPYSGEIYNVFTERGLLKLTPWHPVYTLNYSNGKQIKKRADELIEGDLICVPTSGASFEDYVEVPYRQIWKCRFCGHEARGGNRKQCKKCNKYNWHSGKEITNIKVDETLAFFVGLVASDGHVIQKTKAIEYTGNDERIINEFENIADNLFGKKCKRYKDKRCECLIRTRLHSVEVWNMIQDIGILKGNKSLTLELPEIISKSPRSVFCAFIAGVIEGDGNISENGRIRISSGSEQFCKKVCMALKTFGINCSFSASQIPKKPTFENAKPGYSIRLSSDPEILKYLRVKKTNNDKCNNPKRISSSQVTRIEKDKYSGFMYDFTVKKYHNYVANGMFVSNTHCAGIIAAEENGEGVIGVAPKARLYIAKGLGDDGAGSDESLANSIRWAMSKGVDIINMSLGAPAQYGPMFEKTTKAIQDAYKAGITIICASGNENSIVGFPACMPETIAVAAVNNKEERASFSNKGQKIDFAAAGVDILSTYKNNSYCEMSGTCIQEGSYVYGPNGPKKIEDVKPGDIVFASKNGSIVERPVLLNHFRGRNETIRLISAGRDVFTTQTHEILCLNTKERDMEWVRIKNLQDYHKILMPKKMNTNINPYLDSILEEDFCWLLGFILGDGWIGYTSNGAKRIHFANGDKQDVIEKFYSIYHKYSGKHLKNGTGGWSYDDCSKLAFIIEILGFHHSAKDKTIPLWVWNLSESKQLAFYNGYLRADTHSAERYGIEESIECSSLDLVRRLSMFADYKGWHHSACFMRERENNAPNATNHDLRSFYSTKIRRSLRDGGWSDLRMNISSKRINGQKIAQDIGIDINNIFASNFKLDEKSLITSNVYDLTVPDADCFVTQGIITHNSMACPEITGIAALILAEHKSGAEKDTPINNPENVREHIRKICVDLGNVGHDIDFGDGIPIFGHVASVIVTPDPPKGIFRRFFSWISRGFK